MTINENLPRRAVLIAGLGGAGALALAACSSSSGSAATDSATAEPAGAGTKAPAAPDSDTVDSDSDSAADSPSESGTGQSSESGGGTLASLDDLTIGKSVSVDLAGGKPGLLTRTGSDSVACFSAICTHQGCTVKAAGATLDCPCHGSKYNAKTGAVLAGPAPAPLPTVRVKIAAGKVVEA